MVYSSRVTLVENRLHGLIVVHSFIVVGPTEQQAVAVNMQLNEQLKFIRFESNLKNKAKHLQCTGGTLLTW